MILTLLLEAMGTAIAEQGSKQMEVFTAQQDMIFITSEH
jgi:hypothetical protein